MTDIDPKNILPLPPEFVACGEDFDRFVIGFPRSGSRWVAIMMMHFARAENGFETDWLFERAFQIESRMQLPPVPLEQIFVRNVYDPGVDWNRFAAKSTPAFPVVCRSHTCEGVAEREGAKIVYVVRHPAGMAESYIAFAREQNLIAPDQHSHTEFVEGRVREWIAMVDRAIKLAGIYPEKFIFLRYKEGLPFTIEDLRSVLDHFGQRYSLDDCETVIQRFATLRERLNQPGVCTYTRFGREGTPQKPEEDIDPALWHKAEQLFETVSKLCV
ncbi:MAG: hypothetical protein CMO55_26085 [Verrucomicrobiales bacterium]|nr:hypothetical protein [Verrucomicrobiales bacterium]